ncbi:MAG TPA: hypothetical protein VJ927_10650 [Actinomycetota bacterium]|nr:hypothetical protein [Actinomycetota bacterium]
MSSGLPEGAEELYTLPLDEFTARRNELVKELKAAGDAEAAAAVSALKKPKQSAWIVNQLSRLERATIGELLEIADRLSEGGSREAIRKATAERHELVRRLMRSAASLSGEVGRTPSPTTLEEVRRTLYAAVDEGDRDLLQRGMLTVPIEASGFGTEWALEDDEPEPEPSAADRKRQRELEKLEGELKRAEEDANSAAGAADRARRALEDAEAAEAEARAKVDRLRGRLDGLV